MVFLHATANNPSAMTSKMNSLEEQASQGISINVD